MSDESYYDQHIKPHKEWLKTLKAGDTACFRGSGLAQGSYTEVRIKRITPTGIIVATYVDRDYEIRFDREGRHRTDRWHSNTIEPLTEAIKNAWVQTRNRIRVERFEFHKLTDEEINKVYDVLAVMGRLKRGTDGTG